MQQVLQNPVIILFFILFLTIIIGFVIVFIVTYQKKQLFAKITIANMQQAFETQLAQTQLEVQEQTLQNIAVELHDNIGQLLSLTNVTLASVDVSHADKAKHKIDDALQLVNRSVRELRQLSKILQGEQLIEIGLAEAIQQELSWLQRKGYYTIQFNNETTGIEFNDTDKNLFIYRLFQESLNNIMKHAGANKITILLKMADTNLHLNIMDNGNGFKADEAIAAGKGMGLNNMHKRAKLVNGSMHINSAKNIGTTVGFIIPYKIIW